MRSFMPLSFMDLKLEAPEFSTLMTRKKEEINLPLFKKHIAFLLYYICRCLIYSISKKSIKTCLKMVLALANGRIMVLKLLTLSHIYKSIGEFQARWEGAHFMIKKNIYEVL